ncbi:hypothetical protein C8J57DRAFT_1250552 [Mycena rebaudengoi]|nr:hypothetical protein C8J57DRAFT_1250552 [Mycena rebaudengoi]
MLNHTLGGDQYQRLYLSSKTGLAIEQQDNGRNLPTIITGRGVSTLFSESSPAIYLRISATSTPSIPNSAFKRDTSPIRNSRIHAQTSTPSASPSPSRMRGSHHRVTHPRIGTSTQLPRHERQPPEHKQHPDAVLALANRNATWTSEVRVGTDERVSMRALLEIVPVIEEEETRREYQVILFAPTSRNGADVLGGMCRRCRRLSSSAAPSRMVERITCDAEIPYDRAIVAMVRLPRMWVVTVEESGVGGLEDGAGRGELQRGGTAEEMTPSSFIREVYNVGEGAVQSRIAGNVVGGGREQGGRRTLRPKAVVAAGLVSEGVADDGERVSVILQRKIWTSRCSGPPRRWEIVPAE